MGQALTISCIKLYITGAQDSDEIRWRRDDQFQNCVVLILIWMIHKLLVPTKPPIPLKVLSRNVPYITY